MGFYIDPQVALEVYECAKSRLEELEDKRALLLQSGISLPQLEALIAREKEEMECCAYFAFGDGFNNDE